MNRTIEERTANLRWNLTVAWIELTCRLRYYSCWVLHRRQWLVAGRPFNHFWWCPVCGEPRR